MTRLISKEHTVYMVKGCVVNVYPKLLDIHGEIVYTNKYKDCVTKIVNPWDYITVIFKKENNQCGDFTNNTLHYIDSSFYILIDDKLQKIVQSKDSYIWEL